MDKVCLKNLFSEEYEHELDKSTLDKLHKTPGLEMVTKKFVEMGLEKGLFLEFTSSCIKCSENTFPNEINILHNACNILGLIETPEMYILDDPYIGARTFGVKRPIIILNSGSLDKLNDNELLFLLGHEIGHIKSKHILYHQLDMFFPMLASALGNVTFGLSKIPTMAIQVAVSRWSRASDLTSDRAGLLACQDINTSIDVFMKISGIPNKYYGKIQRRDFIEQLKDFNDFDFGTIDKMILLMTASFGNSVNIVNQYSLTRSAFLLKWHKNGEYQNLLERHKHQEQIRVISTVKCNNCGVVLDKEDIFCASCGMKVN